MLAGRASMLGFVGCLGFPIRCCEIGEVCCLEGIAQAPLPVCPVAAMAPVSLVLLAPTVRAVPWGTILLGFLPACLHISQVLVLRAIWLVLGLCVHLRVPGCPGLDILGTLF